MGGLTQKQIILPMIDFAATLTRARDGKNCRRYLWMVPHNNVFRHPTDKSVVGCWFLFALFSSSQPRRHCSSTCCGSQWVAMVFILSPDNRITRRGRRQRRWRRALPSGSIIERSVGRLSSFMCVRAKKQSLDGTDESITCGRHMSGGPVNEGGICRQFQDGH